jgi:hypothetical protein
MLQCLMSVFVKFLLIGLNSNYFSCSHDILKIQLYKQILQFQHQIKLKHENQANVRLVLVCVIVTTPMYKDL